MYGIELIHLLATGDTKPMKLADTLDGYTQLEMGLEQGEKKTMPLAAAVQPGRATLAERGEDFYETPAEATRALLQVETLPHIVWEPAAGRGAIVDVLRSASHEVVASDLIDYGEPTQASRRDFLMERKAPPGCTAIVTNPPFKLAEKFVEHGLTLCPLVIMLLRLAFLESEKRTIILDTGKLARIHVFRNRLPMMHRDGWSGNKATSAIPFAWFVWDANYYGRTALDRISWR